jgi:signal transduction histidine kinase
LRDDIFGSLIPAFLFLALGVVLFNFALSGYFFSPLNKILQIMRNYKPGRGPVDTINTSTKEFEKMQDLFLEMIHRIDEDYNSLKEYTENMSHEIQTPLAIIRNKLENLMAREKIMQHHAGEIKLIYDEVNYLSRLGNTLNLLTKIENREFMNAVTLKTKPVIEKHVNTIKESAETKSLHIEQILDDDHRVFMDPVLFDIIIKNVLKNAVLYASSEGPVRIESFKDSLRISNSGPPLGISEEQLFKRFNRKNNSSKSLGLGLAIVKKICELNDLRISYKYEEGRHVFSIQNP